jgi:uncharacterized protein with von Willebrand factor type A (vWA) domain
MNAKQKKLNKELLKKYESICEMSPGIIELIETLACVILEEQQLQTHCNKHGTTYQMTAKSGDLMSRQSPEWQQLKETRLRKQALVTYIERKISGTDDTDELTQLLMRQNA